MVYSVIQKKIKLLITEIINVYIVSNVCIVRICTT